MTTLENGSDLTGQVALVTGASRLQGIGAAICRALAARGADVSFNHWRPADAAFPWSGAASETPRIRPTTATSGSTRRRSTRTTRKNHQHHLWPGTRAYAG